MWIDQPGSRSNFQSDRVHAHCCIKMWERLITLHKSLMGSQELCEEQWLLLPIEKTDIIIRNRKHR